MRRRIAILRALEPGYPASSGNDIDVSLGVPVLSVDQAVPLLPALRILLSAAVDIRANRYPDLPQDLPIAEAARDQAAQWLRDGGHAIRHLHDGAVVETDITSPAGHVVRLDLFAFAGVLAVRACADWPELLSEELAWPAVIKLNQMAPAGSVAWDGTARRAAAQIPLHSELYPIDKERFDWAVAMVLRHLETLRALIRRR